MSGFLYVVQLLPDVLPGRIKIGFSKRPRIRLQNYRTSCPQALLLGVWECSREGEGDMIRAMMEKSGGECVGGEVYDVSNPQALTSSLPMSRVEARQVPEPLATVLRNLRGTGIPNGEMVSRFGISRATMYLWENGRCTPRKSTLMQVAAGLREYAREIEALAADFRRLAGYADVVETQTKEKR